MTRIAGLGYVCRKEAEESGLRHYPRLVATQKQWCDGYDRLNYSHIPSLSNLKSYRSVEQYCVPI